MTKQSITQILEKFSRLKVLIVGDVMVDSYIWGNVTRISPEAPVPVVSQRNNEYRMGGAANVARNIRSLGAEPILCSVIGNDSGGELFTRLLNEDTLSQEGIVRSATRITTVKTRVICGSQHLLRIDHETEEYLDKTLEEELYQRFEYICSTNTIGAIIFQDYDKGAITPGLIEKITGFACENRIPVLVDPKKRNFNHYRNVTLFKPNFRELIEGLNIHVGKKDFDSIFNAAKMLHSGHDFKLVMITLSEHGMLISDNKTYHVVPAEKRDIADVSGAGDTVISMAALCLAIGLSPKNTAFLCNISGGLVCEKIGVVPVDKNDLIRELEMSDTGF